MSEELDEELDAGRSTAEALVEHLKAMDNYLTNPGGTNKMKVKNETQYDTRYLRRLFLTCEKHSFDTYLQHSNPKQRTVKVVNHRTNWIGGYASYNGTSIIMKLPSRYTGHRRLPKWVRPHFVQKGLEEYVEPRPLSAREVAKVYLHELGHNLGLHHNKMIQSNKINVSWWPDEAIPLKQIKEKPKQNIIELRAARAQKKLEQWQTKLKRARTYVKKYQQRVKRYELKMAACKTKIEREKTRRI